MSGTWPELIQRFNNLTAQHADKLASDLLFERIILCETDRSVMYAATRIDHRLDTQSGHSHLDNICNTSYTPAMVTIDDLIEMEATSPSTDHYVSFNFPQSSIHYVPWIFNVIRQHVGVIAKSVYNNPTILLPIDDLSKMELLLNRLSKITIEFRVHMGDSRNMGDTMALALGRSTPTNANERLRNDVIQTVTDECDIIKPLVEVARIRQGLDGRKYTIDSAVNEIDRINRTFRW